MDVREREIIARLVGPASDEDLSHVECFLFERLALFMPLGGRCGYAISENHTHPGWMFVLSFDSHTAVETKKERLLSEADSLLILAPGVPHTEVTLKENPRYLAIFVDPRFLEKQRILFDDKASLPEIRTIEDCGGEIYEIARSMIKENEHERPGSGAVEAALSVQLVQSLLRAVFGYKIKGEKKRIDLDLEKVTGCINADLGTKISVSDLARSAGMSSSNFGRQFKKMTGQSPAAYILDTRLKAARRLLKSSTRPVTDIAMECGFSTPSHLATAFKRRYRETPLMYRGRLG